MSTGSDPGEEQPHSRWMRLLEAVLLALGLAGWFGAALVAGAGLLAWDGYQTSITLTIGGVGILLVFISAVARGYVL